MHSQQQARQEHRQQQATQEHRQQQAKEKQEDLCEKPKAEREEHLKHTKDLHIQLKVNEECAKNTLKTGNRRNHESPTRTRSSKCRLKRMCLMRHLKNWSAIERTKELLGRHRERA